MIFADWKKKTLISAVLILSVLNEVYSLDFAILNKGDIIFQEIFIENPGGGNNYYHNFGIDGLEPGARHNIHIFSTEEFLICSFYLYGISQENYVIEDVAIEENSIVYILPEHYIEKPEEYSNLTDPDAIYGLMPFEGDADDDRTDPFPEELFGEGAWEYEKLSSIEVFNYTNSRLFRAYLLEGENKEGKDFLKGSPLEPSESRTLNLPLVEDISYELKLSGGDGKIFSKSFTLPLDADFLVFDDSDELKDYSLLTLEVENGTNEELTEIYLVDQESSKRIEILQTAILPPLSLTEVLIEDKFTLCDVIARTAAKGKIYIFDYDLSKGERLLITDF